MLITGILLLFLLLMTFQLATPFLFIIVFEHILNNEIFVDFVDLLVCVAVMMAFDWLIVIFFISKALSWGLLGLFDKVRRLIMVLPLLVILELLPLLDYLLDPFPVSFQVMN